MPRWNALRRFASLAHDADAAASGTRAGAAAGRATSTPSAATSSRRAGPDMDRPSQVAVMLASPEGTGSADAGGAGRERAAGGELFSRLGPGRPGGEQPGGEG